jgi:hypothetical protein
MKPSLFINQFKGLSKRMSYKTEFIRRNRRFKEIKGKIVKTRSESDDYRYHFRKDMEFGKELLPEKPVLGAAIIHGALHTAETLQQFSNGKDLEEMLGIAGGLSTIDLVFSRDGEIYNAPNLNYGEPFIFDDLAESEQKTVDDWKKEREEAPDLFEEGGYQGVEENILSLDAVDKKNKTILIRIHLDRKKEDIRRDITFLINLLEWESRKLSVPLGNPKKPQWDVYDKYLQVHDLKKTNPEMSWSDIALKVFPRETVKNTSYKRKPRRPTLPQQTAIDKVKNYWKQANIMINEGGWRRI